ncbi:MAG: HIT domain-containing protein [Syntrophales bacterium]|jgi:ATP adenylyltransferase|nr:HIT domain-containing protein [Syntrophales bacterium]
MDVIFAPWRMAYVRKSERTEGCIFCKGRSRSDDLMLREGRTAFVMMNRYPYTTGHLMVIPFRHVGEIAVLTKEERAEMFDLLDLSTDALRRAMNPDGFNIGMNLGRAAGAGVDDHLHVHIVPRWNGDTNFMGVVGEVRVIPEDVARTRDRLRPFLENTRPGGLK